MGDICMLSYLQYSLCMVIIICCVFMIVVMFVVLLSFVFTMTMYGIWICTSECVWNCFWRCLGCPFTIFFVCGDLHLMCIHDSSNVYGFTCISMIVYDIWSCMYSGMCAKFYLTMLRISMFLWYSLCMVIIIWCVFIILAIFVVLLAFVWLCIYNYCVWHLVMYVLWNACKISFGNV